MNIVDDIVGGEFKIDTHFLESDFDIGVESKSEGQEFASGRTALYAILLDLKSHGYNRILVPDFLCGSIFLPIFSLGLKWEKYHINKNMMPELLENCLIPHSAVLLINYFGMLDLAEMVSWLKAYSDIKVIIDDVQAYFSEHIANVDYRFISLRKWFPVPDGAYVYAEKNVLNRLEVFSRKGKFARYKFAGNLLKNYTAFIGDNLSLDLIGQGEDEIDNDYLVKHTRISNYIMPQLDLEIIAKQRKMNAKILHEALLEMGITHLYSCEAVPLFIPILISNRDNIRKALFQNKIFCPIHWPKPEVYKDKINPLYDEELSLICDQRYGEEEMRRQLEVIKSECNNYR